MSLSDRLGCGYDTVIALYSKGGPSSHPFQESPPPSIVGGSRSFHRRHSLQFFPYDPNLLLCLQELDHVDLDVHKTLAGMETQIKQAAKAFCRRERSR